MERRNPLVEKLRENSFIQCKTKKKNIKKSFLCVLTAVIKKIFFCGSAEKLILRANEKKPENPFSSVLTVVSRTSYCHFSKGV